ncbi:MAG: hypothetical protein OMM_02768 [Candidatus Magnetoglobus multicellularis str. Araruama]|uniref:Uncharacterized protein n=1 Tax=Candidatus Magnetoglobus multicellularis str. Araruama TaxID=890399 RepID=A0A1V1P8E0_9BACT|nr:MAG: hypothetical protein OMM_02768 [Candidatus Magnetoglobus multicellularis str. Araruama]
MDEPMSDLKDTPQVNIDAVRTRLDSLDKKIGELLVKNETDNIKNVDQVIFNVMNSLYSKTQNESTFAISITNVFSKYKNGENPFNFSFDNELFKPLNLPNINDYKAKLNKTGVSETCIEITSHRLLVVEDVCKYKQAKNCRPENLRVLTREVEVLNNAISDSKIDNSKQILIKGYYIHVLLPIAFAIEYDYLERTVL